MKKLLPLELIAIDGGTQQRDIDDTVVARYAALIKEGYTFPPVDVIFDGKRYCIWDGFHRYHAARRAGKEQIECNIENGTQREAIWFSFSANKQHGFPRQEGTGKQIILRILADPEWSKLSQLEIAKWVGVTQGFVSKVKAGIEREKADNATPKCITGNTQKPASPPQKQGKFEAEKNKCNTLDTETSAKKDEKVLVADAVGQNVPDNLRDVFMRQNELKMLIHQITTIVHQVKEAKAKNDLLYYYINAQNVEVEAGNLKRSLKAGIPHAVCGYCGGSGGKCRTCDGQGWVNELRYVATAKELKK